MKLSHVVSRLTQDDLTVALTRWQSCTKAWQQAVDGSRNEQNVDIERFVCYMTS